MTLSNATTLIGRITLVSADSVRVVSAAMTATVARLEVRSVRAYPASALHDGVLWPENPHATRLLFAPTAIPLRRGEGYVADFWIFFASAATGITITAHQNTARLIDHSRFASQAKPEKVVKAPQIPTNRNKRSSPDVKTSTGPATAEPITLTPRSPQGNTVNPVVPEVRTVSHLSSR